MQLLWPFATKSTMELQFHHTPGSTRSSQLHKICQSRCTAKNSWWWTERLPETRRVVIPIKLEFSASVGLIHKQSVTMHGHTIIKFMELFHQLTKVFRILRISFDYVCLWMTPLLFLLYNKHFIAITSSFNVSCVCTTRTVIGYSPDDAGSMPRNELRIIFIPKLTNRVLFSLHSLPGATTHAGSWPTQEAASNHLYLWPWPSSFWLPTSLYPSSFDFSLPMFFNRGRLLACCPTPNLEDQGASLSLDHHLRPVRQGRPYQ